MSDTRAPAPEPTTRRGRRRVVLWICVGLVLAVIAAGGAAYQIGLLDRWLDWRRPSPTEEPAEVPPPPGLDLPASVAAGPVAQPWRRHGADPGAVRRAVARLVHYPKLGRRVAVAVAQLSDGARVYRRGVGLVTPASTMKVLTSVAALEALGPEHRFRTTAVRGATARQVVLVGGGDPLLASRPDASGELYPARADIQSLARKTGRALAARGRTAVRLRYDATLFSGPSVNPHWEPSYVPDGVVSPISALWVDEGRETPGLAQRVADPAAAAAEDFAEALGRQGITVLGTPRPVDSAQTGSAQTGSAQSGSAQTGSAQTGEELAAVQSAPLSRIVQWVLEVSDNEAAEVLFRHVALAEGLPGSFDGGARAVRRVLHRLGVDTSDDRILDGSGLSRRDRLRPETLLAVLGRAAGDAHPELRPAAAGLPVAGFSGSLAHRFDTGDVLGLGTVRAKTGTLTGVQGLAGYVTDADGTVMTFAVVADRIRPPNTLDARGRIDEIAAALAGCECGA